MPPLKNVTNTHPSAILHKRENFAVNVQKLINHAHEKDPSIVHWVCNGEAFFIDPKHPDLGNLLGKYFQHSRYASFQRQLNQYGWQKARSGKYTGAFYNPKFHRDHSLETLFSINRGGCKKKLAGTRPLEGQSTTTTTTTARRTSSRQTKPKSFFDDSSEVSLIPKKPKISSGVTRSSSSALIKQRTSESPTEADLTAVEVLLKLTEKKKVPSGGEEANSSGKRSNSFAEIVHQLVTEVDAREPSLIKWADDGSAFYLDPTHSGLGDVLAKYFQHSNYPSFQRQLNQYGWTKDRNTGRTKADFDKIFRKDKAAWRVPGKKDQVSSKTRYQTSNWLLPSPKTAKSNFTKA